MEKFKEYEDIYGKVNISYLTGITQEIFTLAADIRKRLGKKGYMLEKYLSCFLDGALAVHTHEAAEKGFYAYNEMNELINTVLAGNSDRKEHPLYEKVEEYIKTHPLEFQERETEKRIYSVAMSSVFLEFQAEKYRHEFKKKLRFKFDTVEFDSLHRDIAAATGDGSMEKLNLLLRQRFMLVTPMAAFVQGLTDDLLYALTSRDDETSKLTVGLWLDLIDAERA